MNVIGIGVDLVDKERIRSMLEKHGDRLRNRLLGHLELEEYERLGDKAGLLARRFAAKEAISKVLGTGIAKGVRFVDLMVTHDDNGKPLVVVENRASEIMQELGIREIMISISDEKTHAVAFAIGKG
jgi:holo-[acyl-carrier protein] synthase